MLRKRGRPWVTKQRSTAVATQLQGLLTRKTLNIALEAEETSKICKCFVVDGKNVAPVISLHSIKGTHWLHNLFIGFSGSGVSGNTMEIGEAVNTQCLPPPVLESVTEAIAQASLPCKCGTVRLIWDCAHSQSIAYPDKLKLSSQQWNILLVWNVCSCQGKLDQYYKLRNWLEVSVRMLGSHLPSLWATVYF